MHKRYDGQRQNIIDSLDNLLFQLYSLSFFLAPALLPFICRVASQFMSYKPREVDSKLSLRVWFLLLCASNLPSFWSHARDGASEGRFIILDFVGAGYLPSKLHLLLLDVFILLLQMVLTTISYEKSLYSSSSTVPDVLLPTVSSPTISPLSTSLTDNETTKRGHQETPWVIDLRVRHIISRLREPAPPLPENAATLPLPNTTPLPVPFHLRAFMRYREDARRRTQTQLPQRDTTIEAERSSRQLPGGVGVDDVQ
ncbi:hypothetical protein ID866_8276 [Astraeus odoratus]|nr:hypothetical protein ID866_8276 [Astraeus odoratus]